MKTFIELYIGYHAIVFVIAGSIGALFHHIGRGLADDESVHLPKLVPSLLTLLLLVAAAAAANAVGALDDMKMTAAVSAGFTGGWAAHSGLAIFRDVKENKDNANAS